MDTCATVQCLMEMKNQKKCPGNRNKEDKFIHKKLEYSIILIEYNCQNGETTASFIYSNDFNNLSFTGEWPCLAMQIMICHLSEAKAEVAWRCCSAAKLLKEGSEAKWFRRVQIRHQRLQFANLPYQQWTLVSLNHVDNFSLPLKPSRFGWLNVTLKRSWQRI